MSQLHQLYPLNGTWIACHIQYKQHVQPLQRPILTKSSSISAEKSLWALDKCQLGTSVAGHWWCWCSWKASHHEISTQIHSTVKYTRQVHNNPTWHELGIARDTDWDAADTSAVQVAGRKCVNKRTSKFQWSSNPSQTGHWHQLWALDYYCGKKDNEEVVFRRRKSGRCNWPKYWDPSCQCFFSQSRTWFQTARHPAWQFHMARHPFDGPFNGTSHLQGLQGRWLHIRACGERPYY